MASYTNPARIDLPQLVLGFRHAFDLIFSFLDGYQWHARIFRSRRLALSHVATMQMRCSHSLDEVVVCPWTPPSWRVNV